MYNLEFKPIIFIFTVVYHTFVLNLLLKHLIYFYSKKSKITLRPLEIHKSKLYSKSLGMPSGHTENITMMMLTLIWYQKIPVLVGLNTILIVMLQRILTYRHTLRQVIGGFFMGCIYTVLYIKTGGYSYSSLIITVLITMLYIFLLEEFISKKIKQIPTWLEKERYKTLILKQQSKWTYKQRMFKIFKSILYISFNRTHGQKFILYYEYSLLKRDLDEFIKTFDFSQIDIIMGIGIDGNIIGNYIASQTKKHFTIDSISINNKKIMLIYGKINNNIGKEIELLKESKNIVLPYVYSYNVKYPYISDDIPMIWPWGG